MDTPLKNLIGKTILKIFINREYLKFETNKGELLYKVDGDCCSISFLYDFYGIQNLLKNGKITAIKEIPVHELKTQDTDECTQIYGIQLFTENKKLGTMTSVFSFRNQSNGYYGGDIEEITNLTEAKNEKFQELTKDIEEIK